MLSTSKEKQPTRNWLDLPSDVMGNILYRIGVTDILENAQKVCTTWRTICKHPSLWRVVYMDYFNASSACFRLQLMCRNVVDRSQGQLVDITLVGFVDDCLLSYLAHRANQLRRLVLVSCYGEIYGTWAEFLKNFSLLEELSLYQLGISEAVIKSVARYCPLLRVLKVNEKVCRFEDEDNVDESLTIWNKLPIEIGKKLHELRHLELIGHNMSNIGLQAILDGCSHLESLDVRSCFYIDLKGDLGKRCSQQIKNLKLPNDSLADCPYIYESESDTSECLFNPGTYPSDYGYESEYDELWF